MAFMCLALWVFVAVVLVGVLKFVNLVWIKPARVERYFACQGVTGPKYQLLFGNAKEMMKMMQQASYSTLVDYSHDVLPRVLSFYHHWSRTYGRTFVMWFGPVPRLGITEPELVREILSLRHKSCEKTDAHSLIRKLEGDGLLNLKGDKWVQHRRIINPAFRMQNLKSLVPVMADSAGKMLDKWEESMETGNKEIEVCSQFQDLSADVIGRAAFGSSYDEGKEIIHMQTEQMVFASEAFQKFLLPFSRFLPTKKNMHQWKLEREIKRRMCELIKKRENGSSPGSDLLGIMINAKEKYSSEVVDVHDIMEECKTFFFAGRQTTSTMLTWTMILLAIHKDWQDEARKQVLQVCGDNIPDKNSATHLKMLDMIVNESLRLYPPAVAVIRKTNREIRLGKVSIPKDMELMIPILALHHDKSLWGEGAHEFNPGRFSNGVSQAANHPSAFMPFGAGPRTCIGRNFALMDAKIVLAMILQRFTFEISPNYRHAPSVLMMLYPQYGAQIVFHKR